MIQENKITTLLLVLSEAKNGFTDENKFHFQILRHSTFHQSCSAEPVVDSSFVPWEIFLHSCQPNKLK